MGFPLRDKIRDLASGIFLFTLSLEEVEAIRIHTRN